MAWVASAGGRGLSPARKQLRNHRGWVQPHHLPATLASAAQASVSASSYPGKKKKTNRAHCLGCAGRVSGVATMGVGRLPPPPGSILALKKCTFSYVVSNLKCFFVRKFLDFEILAPPPGRFCSPPLENFLAMPLGRVLWLVKRPNDW